MVQKVFIIKDTEQARFICPDCGKVWKKDVSQFTSINKQVKIKCVCSCKHEFSVFLERRRHVRRKVDLDGVLTFQKDSWPVKIIDISRLGLLIVSQEELELAPEQKIVVSFRLDDATHSFVEKEVVIKSVVGNEIGVKFLSQDHYDKLGPYLLFHFD